MRKIVLAFIALPLAATAQAGNLPVQRMSEPVTGHVIQVQDFNSRSAPSEQGNDWDRRHPRFVCVVTPPDSAERSRPYVCPVQQGRVGGRCRCSGVVGSGTIDTAW